MFGPDSTSSLTMKEIRKLVLGVKQISYDINKGVNYKSDNSNFFELKKMFEKSLCVNKDLKKGDIINFDDLESKKPANIGIKASDFKNIVGKKLIKDLKKWDFISYDDINN